MVDDPFASDSEDSFEEDVEKVQIKFITKLEEDKWKAPESSYYVPITLTRYGISEVINSLLQLGM